MMQCGDLIRTKIMLKSISKHPNTDAYIQQIIETLDIPGDVAECGVYKGQNTFFFSQTLLDNGSEKTLHAFDSFCGFPQDSKDGVDLKKFSDVKFEDVFEFLSQRENVSIHKGYFDEVLPSFGDLVFSCVILDCDLYDSYKTCLEFFYPRMSPGGVIVLDEYFSKKYPLARVAIDEFCKTVKEKPDMFKLEDTGWERWRIVKE